MLKSGKKIRALSCYSRYKPVVKPRMIKGLEIVYDKFKIDVKYEGNNNVTHVNGKCNIFT
jgi:hypothetical protein